MTSVLQYSRNVRKRNRRRKRRRKKEDHCENRRKRRGKKSWRRKRPQQQRKGQQQQKREQQQQGRRQRWQRRLKKKQTSVSTVSIEAPSEAQVTRKRPSRTYTLREKRVRCDALDLDGPSNLSGIVVSTAGNTRKMVL